MSAPRSTMTLVTNVGKRIKLEQGTMLGEGTFGIVQLCTMDIEQKAQQNVALKSINLRRTEGRKSFEQSVSFIECCHINLIF